MSSMDFWAAIGGAANAYLGQQKTEEEERRWQEKQRFLENLRRESEKQRDAEKEQRRIIASTPDYDKGEIIETLGSGQSRTFKMPEAAQQAGIRDRVMSERERLLKERDAELAREKSNRDEARAEKQLGISQQYASTNAENSRLNSLETMARIKALQEGKPEKPITPEQERKLFNDIQNVKDKNVKAAALSAFQTGDYAAAKRILFGQESLGEGVAPAYGELR